MKCNKGLSVTTMLYAGVFLLVIAVAYPFTEEVITEVDAGLDGDGQGIPDLYIANYKMVLAGFLFIIFLMLFVGAVSNPNAYTGGSVR